MNQYEPTVEQKKADNEAVLKSVYREIYNTTISATIANKVGNKELADWQQKALEMLEKTRIEYEALL
jgi:hypothetical protein